MRTQRQGFSIILAIIVTAFLTIVSVGVLDLVVREMKTSSAYWRGVSTQAGAEGALEWALLKLKTHEAGFEDKVVFGEDKESLLLSGKKEFSDIHRNDQILEYEITAHSGTYLGIIAPHEFEVLPLFYDSGAKWQDMEGAAHSFDFQQDQVSDIRQIKLLDTVFSEGGQAGRPASIVWNIVGTRVKDDQNNPVGSGETNGIAGMTTFHSATDLAINKNVILDDTVASNPLRTSVDRKSSIANFMNRHNAKYFVIYNFNDEDVSYKLESEGQFALPETTIYGSSTQGDFKQTLQFTDSRRALFSGLKYSLFSTQ